VKTRSEVVSLVDKLLDEHIYGEIADILNSRGIRPGGSIWPGRQATRFTALRVRYIVHAYGLRLRFERLRERGLLSRREIAARLGVHEQTVTSWAKHGIIRAHAYDGYRCLYEEPANPPTRHCSRWDRLTDRAKATRPSRQERQRSHLKSKEV
jgi:hypothetical protein